VTSLRVIYQKQCEKKKCENEHLEPRPQTDRGGEREEERERVFILSHIFAFVQRVIRRKLFWSRRTGARLLMILLLLSRIEKCVLLVALALL